MPTLTRIEPQPKWPANAVPSVSWGEWYAEVKVPPVVDAWGITSDTEYVAIPTPRLPSNSWVAPVCVEGVWYWDITRYDDDDDHDEPLVQE